MEAIRQIFPIKDGKITIDIPQDFSTESVEVIILPLADKQLDDEKRSLSDFAGKITSFGDGLQYQKKIRTEWE